MPSSLPAVTVRMTQAERDRLAKAAEVLTIRQNQEGRPGKLSISDVAVTAVRKYLKELEDAGVLEPSK